MSPMVFGAVGLHSLHTVPSLRFPQIGHLKAVLSLFGFSRLFTLTEQDFEQNLSLALFLQDGF